MYKRIILGLLAGIFCLTGLFVPEVSAVPCGGIEINEGANCPPELNGTGNEGILKNYIKNVLNVLFIAIGVIAVFMIIYSGIIYMTAAGDPGKIATAKKSIMYAIVGLVIAIMAYAIVNFIIGALQ